VLYSDNSRPNMAEVADDISRCSIKEVEKPAMDRTGGIPMARLPLQAPQNIQGVMTDRSMYFAASPFPPFFFLSCLSYVHDRNYLQRVLCSLLRLVTFGSSFFEPIRIMFLVV